MRTLSAREVVFRRIAQQTRRFPDLDLEPLRTEGLNERDAAFAHAIEDAVLRRWITLGYIAESSLSRPWVEAETKLQATLLVGAAQLLLLDRTAPHAAVDECVEWAKRSIRPGAGAIVNAVLRNIGRLSRDENGEIVRRDRWNDGLDEIPLSDGTALALTDDVMPRDPLRRLSVATSHPLELLRAWMKRMPMRDVRRLALHGVATPPTILNTMFLREPGLVEGFSEAHGVPGHRVFTGTRAQLVDLLSSRNDVWVQDPASTLAITSVSDLRPSLIVDSCAGMGTKTRLLAYTFPEAEVIATDVSPARFDTLTRTFASHPRVRVVPHKSLGDYNGRADLVVLDVPCSNSGVLARRVEARYRFDETRVRELAGIQRQIIADSVPLLARSASGARTGAILYSTCSLDERENEAHVAWADRWHSLRAERTTLRLPEGGPGEAATAWTDGSFFVLLR